MGNHPPGAVSPPAPGGQPRRTLTGGLFAPYTVGREISQRPIPARYVVLPVSPAYPRNAWKGRRTWCTLREILNHDLHTLSNWPKLSDTNRKFLTRDRDPTRFTHVLEFLDQVANVEGYIYKDVVNPFVMAEWPGLKQFRVSKIERDLAEVVFALQNRGWHYVRLAAPPNATIGARASPTFVDGYLWSVVGRRLLRERWHGRATAMLCTDAMILGLLRAERVLARIPGESVQYDDLIAGEDALQQAM